MTARAQPPSGTMSAGKPTILIVAGDPSGDLHASRLIAAIRSQAPEVRVLAAGGPRMREAGAEMAASLEGLGVMGFAEVVSKLPQFAFLMRRLKRVLQQERPQLVIAVDFPGFNLRLCGEAKRAGCRVMYYIAPQAWAWGRGRLKMMASVIDKLAVVFPFEAGFFRAAGIDTEFVGHPLLESVEVKDEKAAVRDRLGVAPQSRLVALLPGSRLQEVRRLLPSMLEAARILREGCGVEVAVGAADSVPRAEIDGIVRAEARRAARRPTGPVKNVAGAVFEPRVFRGVTSDLLGAADAAVIASGSATLEAAIVGTPMVIVYRVSPVSWAIAKRIVSIDTIGLVNIVAGEKIVSEYLQDAIDPAKISEELKELVFDERKRSELGARLARVREALGEPGASRKAASIALGMVGT